MLIKQRKCWRKHSSGGQLIGQKKSVGLVWFNWLWSPRAQFGDAKNEIDNDGFILITLIHVVNNLTNKWWSINISVTCSNLSWADIKSVCCFVFTCGRSNSFILSFYCLIICKILLCSLYCKHIKYFFSWSSIILKL